MSVQEEAEVLRCLLDQHVESCFRSSRAKGNTKDENRQTCIRDIMAAALDLALSAFDAGVAAGTNQAHGPTADELPRILSKRREIEALTATPEEEL